MKKILIILLALPMLAACSSDADTKVTTEPEVQLCCGGGCGTPAGYCCNEAHCGGKCDEELPIWDTVKNAPVNE